jgi:flavin-binding protein dodecin
LARSAVGAGRRSMRRLASAPLRTQTWPSNRHHDEERMMSEHVYKYVELVGSSTSGTDDAIRNAVETAAKTLRHLDWFEVIETRGHVADGKIAHYQVTVKAAFRLDG